MQKNVFMLVTIAVIHPETGRDSHSQKPVSPSDVSVIPILRSLSPTRSHTHSVSVTRTCQKRFFLLAYSHFQSMTYKRNYEWLCTRSNLKIYSSARSKLKWALSGPLSFTLSNFHFNSDHLKQIFKLPHSIVVESYVKAFQCKVINSILYANTRCIK